ncbi:MAG: F0F1 ATP synthase subunit A [Butyricicoccaceae bacterium]
MDISVTGPKVYFYVGPVPITQTIVNTWLVMLVVILLSLWLTHGLKKRGISKKQVVAEMAVKALYNLVEQNMGPQWRNYAPLIGAILCTSVLGSFSSLIGLYSLTNDLSTFLAWAIVVFILITYYKIKTNGFLGYLKGYTEPIAVMTPLNIISEIATPVSMAFRHYGNIASGYIIGLLMYAALGSLSEMILGGLPGIFGAFPLFQIGIPAILNIYFTLFSGCVQPFIFSMLTMMFISSAAETA